MREYTKVSCFQQIATPNLSFTPECQSKAGQEGHCSLDHSHSLLVRSSDHDDHDNNHDLVDAHDNHDSNHDLHDRRHYLKQNKNVSVNWIIHTLHSTLMVIHHDDNEVVHYLKYVKQVSVYWIIHTLYPTVFHTAMLVRISDHDDPDN